MDLLRFLAAMLVVLFHYAFRGVAADDMSIMGYPLLAQVAKYGAFGVELFFLISGFVILMTASRGDLRSFAVSRFVRLYPAFWACCTLTFVAMLVFGGERYSATFPQYLVNMTMLSRFVGVPSIDGVYWSLFVELQFYALVAALLLAKRIHQAEGFFLLWLIATLVLRFIPVGGLRFLLITDYSPYFIGGAMSFLIWSRGITPLRLLAIALSFVLALSAALEDIEQFERHYATPMNEYVVAGIIGSYFMVMLLVATRRMGVLGRRQWLLAGALTYPLYLIHQNLGFMIFNIGFPAVDRHVLFWGTILLMLAIAYCVHAGIERRYAGGLRRGAHRGIDAAAHALARARHWVRPAHPATRPGDPRGRD